MTGDVSAFDLLTEQCNRRVNGQCTLRKCIVRGGWSGNRADYDEAVSQATCEYHEAAQALEEITTLRSQVETLRGALEFYANPENYHAIAFLGDAPCGDFVTDCDEEHGHPDYEDRAMPGKRARSVLKETA